ncbi:MAG: rod shape-determining protein MreC [Oscillospiraceae bacterium]
MNKFNEYLKKNGIRLFIVALLMVGFAAAAIGRAGSAAGALENATVSLAVPIKQGATGFVGWLEGIYSYMFKYDKLAAENQELKDQLAAANNQIRELQAAEDENKRLRELWNLRDKNRELTLESAKIIERGTSNWSSTFTISKGKESDISVGDCVIDSSYNLVGQVTELGSGWATVRTIVDADIRVGALVGEGGSAAMIVGDFALMQKGETKLSYFTDETQIFEGDVILSSGKGGAFPKGLVVGKVSGVKTEAGGQVEYATVAPACELGALTQVFIIKDFNVVE